MIDRFPTSQRGNRRAAALAARASAVPGNRSSERPVARLEPSQLRHDQALSVAR